MGSTETVPELDLPIVLNRASEQPLHKQLTARLREAMLDGRLSAGTRLPSTRALAAALHVSRTVTVQAYDELFAEGYIEGQMGSGTYVGRDLPRLTQAPQPTPASNPRWLKPALPVLPEPSDEPGTIVFRLGTPSITPLPVRVWRDIWRDVANQHPPHDYQTPGGDSELRTAIAQYLGRSRGLLCDPQDVIITSGAVQAVDLIAQATLTNGDYVGFEEPGYPLARHVLLTRGAHIVPIPVDQDGMQVQQLPVGTVAPLLVYTTPSHQYPFGTRLSIARRMELLQWAETNDSLVIEDDYDSEFRFDAPPLPTLASLDKAGRVAYVGTFSKVLTPSLRVGYLVAPPLLRGHIRQLKRLSDYHTAWPMQKALATFIKDGQLDRHIRRMRRIYAEKRKLLRNALAPVAHLVHLQGLEAGLHVYLELRADLDIQAIKTYAQRRGVVITTPEQYYFGPADQHGLLLGYGNLENQAILRGAHILVEAIKTSAAETAQFPARVAAHDRP